MKNFNTKKWNIRKWYSILKYLKQKHKDLVWIIQFLHAEPLLKPKSQYLYNTSIRENHGVTFLIPDQHIIDEMKKNVRSNKINNVVRDIRSLCIMDNLPDYSAFKNKKIINANSNCLDVKSISSKGIVLACGSKIIKTDFIAFDGKNLSVYILKGNIPKGKSMANKKYSKKGRKSTKKGGFVRFGTNVHSKSEKQLRHDILADIESSFAQGLSDYADGSTQSIYNSYLYAATSIEHYLKEHNITLAKSMLVVGGMDPVSFVYIALHTLDAKTLFDWKINGFVVESNTLWEKITGGLLSNLDGPLMLSDRVELEQLRVSVLQGFLQPENCKTSKLPKLVAEFYERLLSKSAADGGSNLSKVRNNQINGSKNIFSSQTLKLLGNGERYAGLEEAKFVIGTSMDALFQQAKEMRQSPVKDIDRLQKSFKLDVVKMARRYCASGFRPTLLKPSNYSSVDVELLCTLLKMTSSDYFFNIPKVRGIKSSDNSRSLYQLCLDKYPKMCKDDKINDIRLKRADIWELIDASKNNPVEYYKELLKMLGVQQ